MSDVVLWTAVLTTSVGCYLLKLVGLSVPSRVLDRPGVRRVAWLTPVALLSALVAVQTLGTGQTVQPDARLAGVAVAVGLLLLRAPFLLVVVAAAATAALLRL